MNCTEYSVHIILSIMPILANLIKAKEILYATKIKFNETFFSSIYKAIAFSVSSHFQLTEAHLALQTIWLTRIHKN